VRRLHLVALFLRLLAPPGGLVRALLEHRARVVPVARCERGAERVVRLLAARLFLRLLFVRRGAAAGLLVELDGGDVLVLLEKSVAGLDRLLALRLACAHRTARPRG